MNQFYTPEKIARFAPFFNIVKNAGGEPHLVWNVFHYGMLNHTLISAVNESKPAVVQFLLRNNPPKITQTLEWLGVIAARKGCMDVIRQFPVTERGLEAATFEGHVQAVEYMLPIQPCDHLMEVACQGGHSDTVCLLESRGYEITDEAFSAAVAFGHLHLIRMFTETRRCPLTAMYRAVSCGNYEITAFLLPQFMNELSFLLLTAACTPHLHIVQLLVEHGAHIELWVIRYTRERGFPQNALYLEEHSH